jgi:hypothetical protein
MDAEHDHPLQSRHLDHDDPAWRRRFYAGVADGLAASVERCRRIGHDPEIGVPFPHHVNPVSLRRWRDDLQRANGAKDAG